MKSSIVIYARTRHPFLALHPFTEIKSAISLSFVDEYDKINENITLAD
jgi:hypothetical protein